MSDRQEKQQGNCLPMDIISLYYFSELAKEPHMTRTAARLFISQQTLSNHIQRLERQLGCQLFERKPSLTLTYAGEQVLVFAKRVLREQVNLQDILADVQDQRRGCIRFGASTLRMNACLPYILPIFSEEYPQVELEIFDRNSQVLEPLIASGELDYALVAGKEYADPEQAPDLCRELLLRDPVFLCVTDAVLQRYLGDRAAAAAEASRNGAALRMFADVPFLMFDNRLGKRIMRRFEEAGVRPRTYIRAPYTQAITRIGLQGTAAFFSTGVILSSFKEEIPDDLHVFPLLKGEEQLYQEIYLLRSRSRYTPAYAARFLDLLRECFREIKLEHNET